MDLQTILKQLSVYDQSAPLPEEALREAIRQKDIVAPALLENMDKLYAYLSTHEEGNWPEEEIANLNTYALYLLAEMRDTRMFSRLLDQLSLTGDKIDYVFGDLLTETAHDLLYSTYGGNPEPLMALAADPSKNPYARSAAVACLGALHEDGRLPHDSFTEWARNLLHVSADAAASDGGPFSDAAEFLGLLVHDISTSHLFALIPEVRDIFDRGLISDMFSSYEATLDYFFDYNQSPASYAGSAEKELSRWNRYKKPGASRENPLALLEYNVGRNDPCPCGSGKKFKKCCLPKKQELERSLQKTNSVTEFRLEHYPPISRSGTRPGLMDFFPKDAIEVDQAAYAGMRLSHTGMFPMRGDQERAELAAEHFRAAFRTYQAICAKEGLKTPEEFDREHRIHYKSREWLERMVQVLKDTGDRGYSAVQAVLDS